MGGGHEIREGQLQVLKGEHWLYQSHHLDIIDHVVT